MGRLSVVCLSSITSLNQAGILRGIYCQNPRQVYFSTEIDPTSINYDTAALGPLIGHILFAWTSPPSFTSLASTFTTINTNNLFANRRLYACSACGVYVYICIYWLNWLKNKCQKLKLIYCTYRCRYLSHRSWKL